VPVGENRSRVVTNVTMLIKCEVHVNLYSSRRDTFDFGAEGGHECLASKALSNFALKWFHNAS
jgi:hypothetical protein